MARKNEKKSLRTAALKKLSEDEMGEVVGGRKAGEKPQEVLAFNFNKVILAY